MSYQDTKSPFISNARKDAGSAMIIALIFSCIITFGIAAILPLGLTDWKMSNRNSGQEAAFSLAESGTEEAIWAILEYGDNEGEWIAGEWEESENKAYWFREFNLSDYTALLEDNYELDENRIGKYRVVVEKVDGATVNIVSQGIVDGGKNVAGDYHASRYIETQFKRPNPFDYGLIALYTMGFSGQPLMGSYHSIEDLSRLLGITNWNGVEPFRDNATVGSLSTDGADIEAGGVYIRGLLVSGSSAADDSVSGRNYDGEVIYDFDMELPEIPFPTATFWNISL